MPNPDRVPRVCPGNLRSLVHGSNRENKLTDGPSDSRYALSFTSGALLGREASVAAPLYLQLRDWNEVRELVTAENLLQARTEASGHRLVRETVQRLEVLSDEELELFVESTASERGHLLWAAACRRYALIGEFAEEVLREKFLLMTPTLSRDDFDSFIRGKSIWHEELTALEESTLRKLRATLFRMLTEAGLLSEDGRIIETAMSSRVNDLLAKRSPSDLRFFPIRVVE